MFSMSALFASGGIMALLLGGWKGLVRLYQTLRGALFAGCTFSEWPIYILHHAELVRAGYKPVCPTIALGLNDGLINHKTGQREVAITRDNKHMVYKKGMFYYRGLSVVFIGMESSDSFTQQFTWLRCDIWTTRLMRQLHLFCDEALQNNDRAHYVTYITGTRMTAGNAAPTETPSTQGQSREQKRATGLASVERTLLVSPLYNPARNTDEFTDSEKWRNHQAPYIPSDVCAEAENELMIWLNSREWYKSIPITWKGGMMLAGPPGTGKSSFVKYLARKLDLPVFIFDLTTMHNGDFHEKMSEIQVQVPCIVLYEDLHGVFDMRENISMKNTHSPGLSFDCFINAIDGVDIMSGIFTIITTNHLEKTDPALLRPGRVDRIIEFTCMTLEQRVALANRILVDLPVKQRQQLIDETEGMVGSVVSERFNREALHHHWYSKRQENKSGTKYPYPTNLTLNPSTRRLPSDETLVERAL